jgi:hypothetical protein
MPEPPESRLVPSLAGECYPGFDKRLVEQMPPVGGDDQEKSGGRYEHPRDNHPEADAPERAVTLAFDEPPEGNPDAGYQKEQERHFGHGHACVVREGKKGVHSVDPTVQE